MQGGNQDLPEGTIPASAWTD